MMSLGAIVLELVQNMSLFAAVVVGYAAIRRRNPPRLVGDLLAGLVFGAGSILAMTLPLQLAPGIILDGRSVLTGSVAFFAGPLGSILALMMAALYRLWIGGAGLNGGILGILLAGIVGQIFFQVARRRRVERAAFTFLLLGLAVVSTTTTAYFLLHRHNSLPLPDGLFEALFLTIPVGTLVFAVMLQREDARLYLQGKLAAQTGLFEAIFNSMSDGVTVADAEGRIILTNPTSVKLAGVSAGDALPGEWTARSGVYLSDGVTSFPARHMPLMRAIRGEATDDIEMIVDNGADRRRLSVSGRPLRDDNGQSRGGVVVFRDNTEQREMQDNLRRSEERFALAIAGSKDGIFDYNPITREVWFSPRYKAILGYGDAEFPNDIAFWKSRMLPEDHKASTEQFFDYEQRRIDTIEIRQRFRHRDGSIVHVQNRAQGTRDEYGRINRLVGAITDVTPLIKAEERLKEAIGAMESGFALFDAEDRLVICNEGFIDPATRARFGMPIGRTFEEIFTVFAGGRLTAVGARNDPAGWLAWRMDRHRNPRDEPMEIQWTDGRWMRVTERRTADGGSVGIWTDITQQKAAESQLRDAIDSINEGFALFDGSLHFVVCNQRYREQYPISAEVIQPGIGLAEVLRFGAARGEFAGVATEAEIDAFVQQWMQRYNCTFPFVQEVENNDGRWLLVSHQRTAAGAFVTLRTDITAQKRREQELRDTQERLKRQAVELERYIADMEEARRRIEAQASEQVSLLENLRQAQHETERAHHDLQRSAAILRSMADSLPALVADIDAAGRYRYCNHSYLDFVGRTADETIGRHLSEIYGAGTYAASVASDVAWVLQGQEIAFSRSLQSRGRQRQIEGKYIPQIDAGGKVNGFFMAAWDVTEQYEREQRLNHEASTDALTGVLNRRAILAEIEKIPGRLAQADAAGREEGKGGVALLYLDIDRFKQINDTLGHAAGDQLLRVFAQRLCQAVRATDLVARLGGDEFVLMLVDVARPAIAERIARQIISQMHEPVLLGDQSLRITTSIGIAYRSAGAGATGQGGAAAADGGAMPGGAAPSSDLLAQADAALYQAKAAGRNTYRLHDAERHAGDPAPRRPAVRG
ncbi:MAG TPA: PAS-domain containing protein [Dongiaceae bacterium]|nr:PAS-domain containing protein [Dongiaceae bacterium]